MIDPKYIEEMNIKIKQAWTDKDCTLFSVISNQLLSKLSDFCVEKRCENCVNNGYMLQCIRCSYGGSKNKNWEWNKK